MSERKYTKRRLEITGMEGWCWSDQGSSDPTAVTSHDWAGGANTFHSAHANVTIVPFALHQEPFGGENKVIHSMAAKWMQSLEERRKKASRTAETKMSEKSKQHIYQIFKVLFSKHCRLMATNLHEIKSKLDYIYLYIFIFIYFIFIFTHTYTHCHEYIPSEYQIQVLFVCFTDCWPPSRKLLPHLEHLNLLMY